MIRSVIAILVTIGFLIMGTDDAHGFEYLEHSYLTDRACWEAQQKLAALLEKRPDDRALRTRYLAMAIACPERSPGEYCADGDKTAAAQLNRVTRPPWRRSRHHLTLGDITGLGDHLAGFGPIQGLSGAQEPGLLQDALRWFADPGGSVGGVIGSVVRKGCSNTDQVSWKEVEDDVNTVTGDIFSAGEPRRIPSQWLSPMARSPVNEGPGDPEARLTMTNPHYLDLVLRNHHHFGEEAFDTWLGFHSASVAIADRSCRATYAIDRRKSRRLARGLPQFDDVDWKNLDDDELAITGCAALAEYARLRLVQWDDSADETLTEPVRSFIDDLRVLPRLSDDEAQRIIADLDAVVASLKGLIFQASGLHYLQDGFAGGHIRTIRNRGGLAEARHDHNYDNEEGVSAVFRTRAGDFPFVAYGDKFLLGNHHVEPDSCDWKSFDNSPPSPEMLTACLLRHQRGLLVATGTASLVDWAVGGMLFEPVEPQRCARSELESTVCDLLPLIPVTSAGSLPPRTLSNTTGLHAGNLPVPPPPFAYESLLTTVAFDVGGSKSQYGLQLTILSEFDYFARWLTSYRTALSATNGVGENSRILGEFSYNFHYRWSARVLTEGGLGSFVGFRGIGDSLSFMSGLTPSAGLAVLPEGWVKIPLELSLSFRLPMTFFTSTHGFFSDSFDIEAYWLQFGLGLAFM